MSPSLRMRVLDTEKRVCSQHPQFLPVPVNTPHVTHLTCDFLNGTGRVTRQTTCPRDRWACWVTRFFACLPAPVSHWVPWATTTQVTPAPEGAQTPGERGVRIPSRCLGPPYAPSQHSGDIFKRMNEGFDPRMARLQSNEAKANMKVRVTDREAGGTFAFSVAGGDQALEGCSV